MKFQDLLLAELEREVARTARVLKNVPDGKHEWKPHDRSMIFGSVADMVATIPSWIAMVITLEEMDIAPKDGPQTPRVSRDTSAEYLAALDKSAAEARSAISGVTDKQLQEKWRLLVGGKVVADVPRHEMLRDTFNHWVHHRGQLTVYLRLLGAPVGSTYGPSADESRFD